MDTVDDIRDMLERCQERMDVQGLDDVLAPRDIIKYKEMLLAANMVMGIMDGHHWRNTDDYHFLEQRLRAFVGTLLSVAWNIESRHPRDWVRGES